MGLTTSELKEIEKLATNIINDKFHHRMLIERERKATDLLSELQLLPNPFGFINFEQNNIFGNRYHFHRTERFTNFEQPITIHLFHTQNGSSLTKKIKPFTQIIIPPKIAYAIQGKPQGVILEQAYGAYSHQDDILYYPVIDLRTGKPFRN